MVVGIVIGSGVFFKAQTILQKTNGDLPLGILAWVIGGAIMKDTRYALPAALCGDLAAFLLSGLSVRLLMR